MVGSIAVSICRSVAHCRRVLLFDFKYAQLFGEFSVLTIMNYRTSLITLVLLATLCTGCSRHDSTSAPPKNNDLGIIEVSDGKPSSRTLADGRVCTITPTLLTDGNVKLATTIIETNASGVKRSSLNFECPTLDRAMTFGFDKDTVITVTLHRSK
jgi:hypothetical protein